mgnify:CR=1 FL=1
MKKLAISTLAVLIACPAFAGNYGSGSSWQLFGLDPYIGLRGGASYTNLNYNFNNTKESVGDMAFQGHVAMGLEICDTVRSEIEWSIFSKAKESKDFGNIADVEVGTNMQTLLWNMYWEFGGYHIVRPYIGLGAGVAFVDIDRNVPNVPGVTDSSTKFSAMGALGITFDMERFAVDIAARYNYVDIQSGLHNFGGDIGIRFMF